MTMELTISITKYYGLRNHSKIKWEKYFPTMKFTKLVDAEHFWRPAGEDVWEIDYLPPVVITITSLEELAKFNKEVGHIILFHVEDNKFDCEIYNGYRE